MTSKMKELAKTAAMKASAFVALAVARANYLVFCTTDAFDDAITASGKLQGRLVSLAAALFPLAIVICGVAMFFTRDQKKFDTEKHIFIGCCLAYALIILVTQGHVATTVQNLFTTASKGGAK